MLKGQLTFPGDKSISHRALMLAALSKGSSVIRNLSTGADVQSTINCLKACGIDINNAGNAIVVHGGPFQNPQTELDCGNSGTSTRLLLGLLAGKGLKATFSGDASLSPRPMNRVLEPLQLMGLQAESENGHLPITIQKSTLKGIRYTPHVASAQVKSAIILAGLGALGTTTVNEPIPTRDHTERILKELGADITVKRTEITVAPLTKPLSTFEMTIPGDPSTAAFFGAAAALVSESELILRNILANPTRTGFFTILEKMGAGMECLQQWNTNGERVGDLKITQGSLRAVSINKIDMPGLIDELPMLAILATQAEGITEVRGAEELRVKESDRIHAICSNLIRMGANIKELQDGFIIKGPTPLKGTRIETFGDHRIAMAFAVAGLISDGPVTLDDPSCAAISFPEFYRKLEQVTR